MSLTRSLLQETVRTGTSPTICESLRSKRLFSEGWYRRQLAKRGISVQDAWAHYADAGWRTGLDPHPLFSTTWYLAANADVAAAAIDPLRHFLHQGIDEGRSPHPLLDLHYIADQLPLPATEPVLLAYLGGAWRFGVDPHPLINRGFAVANGSLNAEFEPVLQYLVCENRSSMHLHPLFDAAVMAAYLDERGRSKDDPLTAFITSTELDIRLNDSFDPAFYLKANPLLQRYRLQPLIHYLKIGRREGQEPFTGYHAHYRVYLEQIPPVHGLDALSSALAQGIDPLAYGQECERLFNQLRGVRQVWLRFGPARAKEMVRERVAATDANPKGQSLAATAEVWNLVLAYLDLKQGRREDAQARLTANGDNLFEGAEARILKDACFPEENHRAWEDNSRHFPSAARLQRRAAGARIAIYTSLFGRIDELPPVLGAAEGCDFICFTDQDVAPRGWEVRQCGRTLDSDVLEAKRFKVQPWLYLPEYDYSLYVDANTLLYGNLDVLVRDYLLGRDFVCWTHPTRSDFLDECFAVYLTRKYAKAPIFAQLSAYLDAGAETGAGMVEASFLWRSHHDPEVRRLMDLWWRQITEHTSRDQISLAYLMQQTGIRPRVLAPTLGDSRKNIFFQKNPHRPAETAKAPGSGKTARPRARAFGRKRCVFIVSAAFRHSGTTVLRCDQAAMIVGRARPEIDVAVRDDFDIRDSLVILSKGALKTILPETIQALRKAGNTVFADFVDAPVRPELVEHLDGLIAASISAYLAYEKSFPALPVFHLTHTVDLRLPRPREIHGLHIGYLGELVNTVTSDRLRRRIDFVQVDTSKPDFSWAERLPEFNCHYAVRKPRPIDGFKPFLKGFTAAHFGAPVIVDEGTSDADYYLGPDYAYKVESTDEDSILACLDLVALSFGTSIWKEMVDRMRSVKERSTHRWFAHEFDQLLNI